MIKEQITVRLKPLIKLNLSKNANQKNYKNVNDYVSDILEKHIMNIKEENKLLDISENMNKEIELIKKTLIELLKILGTKQQ